MKKKKPVSGIAAICSLVGLVAFVALRSTSFEATEKPLVVITAAAICALMSIVSFVKDFYHIPSLVAFAAGSVSLVSLAAGRISYMAFYLNGDVMGTGLSPLLIVSFVAFLAASVFTVFAMRKDAANI